MPGYELTPSQLQCMREFRSLTTSARGHWFSCIILNSIFPAVNAVWSWWSCVYHEFKDTFEENWLKSVFQSHFALFRSFTTPGFNGGWIRGWKRNHLSFVIHNSCLFLPSDSWFIHMFFRDSWFISHCFIQKAENDLKLYMLFCFPPCVTLMVWYKISLTFTNKRASTGEVTPK